MVTLVYGVQQGIGMAFVYIAQYWFLLDNKPKVSALARLAHVLKLRTPPFLKAKWKLTGLLAVFFVHCYKTA
jgi:hypothetical protein